MFDEVRDHWYLRPGWREDRSFYTWHLTFADDVAVARLFAEYEPVIATMPAIAPVPLEWLHLTLQGVGFADRVEPGELRAITEAAVSRLERFSPFEVTIGPAVVDPETVQLPVTPAEPLQRLRDTIRAAIGDVWGPDAIPELPALNPHITLGYFTTSAPAAPLITHLAEGPSPTVCTTFSSISLIALTRAPHLYHWKPVTTLALTTL
jgi:2'-5' RNA ligase